MRESVSAIIQLIKDQKIGNMITTHKIQVTHMTLDEIAKLAGVSKTTASYVINGLGAKIQNQWEDSAKVMAVVDEYNYRPDKVTPSSLRAGNSRSFGFWLFLTEASSYARLAKLIEQNSRKVGYQILIGCSDDDAETRTERSRKRWWANQYWCFAGGEFYARRQWILRDLPKRTRAPADCDWPSVRWWALCVCRSMKILKPPFELARCSILDDGIRIVLV